MTEPLRVFHLIKSFGRGGAEVLLAEGPGRPGVGECVYRFGYFVPWKNAVVPLLLERGNDVVCMPAESAPAIFAQARRVAGELRRFGAELLHCHLPIASIAGRLAGKLAGIPVISTEHNLLERYHPATRAATLLTWRLQRLVIAVSDEVAESIRRHAGTSVPVRVIKNGVPVESFTPSAYDPAEARRALGIPGHAPVIGTVAVLRAQKRFDLWLAAASRILERIPEARFVIVGDGPYRRAIEDDVRARGLGERVILPGFHDDVRPLLAAMDVYLMSSEFEGLPIALLEAMAMARVPVVTAVGGIPEVVIDGVMGAVVPPHDPEALARAVIDVLGSGKLASWGAAARERVASAFSVGRMVRESEALYRSVVAGGPP